MYNLSEHLSAAAHIEYDNKDKPQGEPVSVRGYDANGELLFFAIYGENGEFRLDTYEKKADNPTKAHRQFSSDDLDNPYLPKGDKNNLLQAQNYISGLKTKEPSSVAPQSQTAPSIPLGKQLEGGINVTLSEKSRLSFAPDIEQLTIKKEKDGSLHMKGFSADGKQSIDFYVKDNVIDFQLSNNDLKRKYTNKIGGQWCYRDTTNPSMTQYRDNAYGEKCAKEMAAIMDKVKLQHKNRSNMNLNNLQKSSDLSR